MNVLKRLSLKKMEIWKFDKKSINGLLFWQFHPHVSPTYPFFPQSNAGLNRLLSWDPSFRIIYQ